MSHLCSVRTQARQRLDVLITVPGCLSVGVATISVVSGSVSVTHLSRLGRSGQTQHIYLQNKGTQG